MTSEINLNDRKYLVDLGWDDSLQASLDAITSGETGTHLIGRVSRLDRGWSTVMMSAHGDPIRVRNIGADVAVGDWVLVSLDRERVDRVLERNSALTRRVSSDVVKAESHTVAANIDTVFLVQSASNPPNQRRLERELVLAFDSGARPVFVVNKCDLVDEAILNSILNDIRPVDEGVAVHFVSAVDGTGLDELRNYGRGHRTLVVLGASGVGKSMLVNALAGSTLQNIGEVRSGDQRGRHTTVAAELVPLLGGGWLIDTPGLRAVSLWISHRGIELAFADVFAATENCRFRNCKHESEPGCAVRTAVAAGIFSQERLNNMRALVAEELSLENEQIRYKRSASRKGIRHPRHA
ncbi:MAG: ribosome small subunit-dependent GTPase A [Ilumatobacteraceae bacterium]